MKKKIWVNFDPHRTDIQYIVERLQAAGFDAYAKLVPAQGRAYVEEAKGVDGALVGLEPWDREALLQVKGHLELLVRKGAGYDSVDIAAATECGIPVMNLPGVNAAAVAEIAFLHILNCSRRFSWSMKTQLGEHKPPRFYGRELDGALVGIVGYGNIGKELARMLSGFRTRIMVYDVCGVPETGDDRIIAAESMEQVFAQCDYISLHIPLLPETAGLIDRKYFSLMKPTACLINTSRGGLVNEADLMDALRSGQISAAGLDVVSQEPLSGENPLLQLENAFLTPHIAGDTLDARERQNELAIWTFCEFFSGKIPWNVVNKDVLK